jgi:hypothetical protein
MLERKKCGAVKGFQAHPNYSQILGNLEGKEISVVHTLCDIFSHRYSEERLRR